MFKNAKVVMLPTNQKAKEGLLTLYHNVYSNIEWYLDIITHIKLQDYLKVWTKNGLLAEGKDAKGKSIYQHLYILSDDRIEDNDWCIMGKKELFHNVNNKVASFPDYLKDSCRKIIATTDESLKIEKCSNFIGKEYSLPQPSDSFIERYIESYNNGKPITDILVEYERDGIGFTHDKNGKELPFKLKVDKNNTITIKRVKDTWNYQEHINDIKRLIALYETTYIEGDITQWIKNNL